MIPISQKEKTKSTSMPIRSPYQGQIEKKLGETYSPYIGTGTLGGISDLEQQSVNMLKSADVWGPMTEASKGLLTGTLGATPISSEKALGTFSEAVEKPAMRRWGEYTKPGIKEEYAGPGYWGGARAKAVTEGAEDLGEYLGSEQAKWMWDVDQANRAIEEAKAGRSLSALSTTPGALGTWTRTLFGTGREAREIMNQITDPQVLPILQLIMGLPMGQVTRTTKTPSEFQQAQNWATGIGTAALGVGAFGPVGGALGGLGGGGSTALMSDTLAQSIMGYNPLTRDYQSLYGAYPAH